MKTGLISISSLGKDVTCRPSVRLAITVTNWAGGSRKKDQIGAAAAAAAAQTTATATATELLEHYNFVFQAQLFFMDFSLSHFVYVCVSVK